MVPDLHPCSGSPSKVSLPPKLPPPSAVPTTPSPRSSTPFSNLLYRIISPLYPLPLGFLLSPPMVPGSGSDAAVRSVFPVVAGVDSLPVESQGDSLPKSSHFPPPLEEASKSTALASPSWASIVCQDSTIEGTQLKFLPPPTPFGPGFELFPPAELFVFSGVPGFCLCRAAPEPVTAGLLVASPGSLLGSDPTSLPLRCSALSSSTSSILSLRFSLVCLSNFKPEI